MRPVLVGPDEISQRLSVTVDCGCPRQVARRKLGLSGASEDEDSKQEEAEFCEFQDSPSSRNSSAISMQS
jgi:hypothetical protein